MKKNYDKDKLLKVLIKKLEESIGYYDYYEEDGPILNKIEQILNILKVMNGDTPFEEWYIEDLLEEENE